ncbi:AAA family ATPase [Halanaeroarchaeum sulfurireducens]|uniref:Dephospho-CoA kinase n=1 Tax=Halanaeroarchaeum sulfurireducens TaxID=1604004 RepID=A0A0F7PG57_9EURY|nr:AAA family ATPase [Halanaeroarchaeum sulfurireducens]AKH98584.1 dephospho-CoA kinase [Halanaeroarchaeum sulfurireducens]
MQVIGIVGLPGSGKSEAAAVAREMDIPVVTMGDVVRAETEDRGLDPATDHGAVAQAMREENGPAAIADRSLPIIESRLAEAGTVLVDGIRAGAEVEVFEEAFGEDLTVVEIYAPFDLREGRLSDRGRDTAAEDGGESLAERDERELGFGMDAAIDAADVRIENTGSLEAFRDRVRTLLEEESDP